MEQKIKRQGKNKGFSLVELIVVMAIMAILVGAIAPQVIKYVENAREASDRQIASNLLTAFTTAVGSSDQTVGDFSNIVSISSTDAEYTKISTKVKEICGYTTDKQIYELLKSAAGKKDWTVDATSGASTAGPKYSYDHSTGKITVTLGTISVTNR